MNQSEKAGEEDTTPERLKQEFKELVLSRLRAAGERKCPMCGSNSWNVSPGDFAPLNVQAYEPSEGLGIVIDQNLPSVPVICLVCGNTVLFNLFVLLKDDIKRFPPFSGSGGA